MPNSVDTVIIGNGPSALILSHILHGKIPYYNAANPHPDPILHSKLSKSPCLLEIDVLDLTAHFSASRLSYSTQALPINVLLDTLLRPLADIDPEKYAACIEWRFQEEKAVQHVVLGNAAQAGGQWADNPISASLDICTLSYAEMLSLPGYAFDDYYRQVHGGQVPEFFRPTRREMAAYLARYPEAVGIEDSVYVNEEVGNVRSVGSGFYVGSHNISCKHIVLASGTFSSLITPQPLLRPLSALPKPNIISEAALLVVGSGFTAADVILSTPPNRKIIHIFKWDPEDRPSPLRACHPRAYPEYASVYRLMKLAAKDALGSKAIIPPLRVKGSSPFFNERGRGTVYEGLPNTYIKDVEFHDTSALLTLETVKGDTIQREISNIEYVIGRRGSLSYLDESVKRDIGVLEDPTAINKALISSHTLRPAVEQNLEIAPGVFVTGSLTGDSLIRFAYGGCIYAAREIIQPSSSRSATSNSSPSVSSESLYTATSSQSDLSQPAHTFMIAAGGQDGLHLEKKAGWDHGDP